MIDNHMSLKGNSSEDWENVLN